MSLPSNLLRRTVGQCTTSPGSIFFFFAAAVVNCELGDVWSPIIVHTVNKLVVCKTSPGRRFIFAILPGHLNVASCFVVFFSYQQKERAGGRQGVCKSHPLSFFESNETTTSSMHEESRSPRRETWSLVMPKVGARRPVSFKVFFLWSAPKRLLAAGESAWLLRVMQPNVLKVLFCCCPHIQKKLVRQVRFLFSWSVPCSFLLRPKLHIVVLSGNS